MKKYIILLALTVVTAFTSCIELERIDSTAVQMDNFPKNQNDMKLYIYSLYRPFVASPGAADVWGYFESSDTGLYPLTDQTTDILTTDKFNPTARATITNYRSWEVGNRNYMTPLVNKYFPQVNQLSKDRMAYMRLHNSNLDGCEAYAAEAQAILAWNGIILYDIFGPVPFATDEQLIEWEKSPEKAKWLPRPSSNEFLDYLAQNLIEAIPNLPEKQPDWGRITKGAARMILLRVYLMKGDFVNAKPVAKELYEMGEESGAGSLYGLITNYKDVFSINQQRNKEIILAVPCDGTRELSPNNWYCQVMPSDYPHIAGSLAPGSSTHRMRWAFYDTYNPNDRRLETIVASYENVNGQTRNRTNGMQSGALPFKYDQDPGTTAGIARNDIPVFRYAEAILIYAETLFETEGITPQAINLVNQVRTRAGLPGIETVNGGAHVANAEAFREAILTERGHELYCEGVRHMDLIRHGKWVEYGKRGLTDDQIANFFNPDPRRSVWPIDPEMILQSGGIIEQNEAYK